MSKIPRIWGYAVSFWMVLPCRDAAKKHRSIRLKLFKKRKPEALVFIDFEYMQISFKKRYGIQPPVLDWYREISESYRIADVFVYADFSNPAMKQNIQELRKITNNIIETQNTSSHYKKDFTDFFILDTMYQKAYEKHRAKVFILFTGDGHFGAVSRFLIGKCHKKVVVYGIETTISTQLRSSVSETVEYPSYAKLKKLFYPVIARQMQQMVAAQPQGNQGRQNGRAADHGTSNEKQNTKTQPDAQTKEKQSGNEDRTKGLLTELNVVRAVSEGQGLNQTIVRDALCDMITDGYVSYREQWVSTRRRVKVLSCDWDRMKADGIL